MIGSATTTPLLEGRRILFLVPPGRFDEGEFYQTWQFLSEEGAWLEVASASDTGLAIGESGAAVHTRPIGMVNPLEFDGLVLVEGAEEPRESLERAGAVVARAIAAGRSVGAFGRLGHELLAAGLPVVRTGASKPARFAAELAVKIARQPRSAELETAPE